MTHQAQPHPAFESLAESWELALDGDSYAPRTIASYRRGLRSFAAWMAEHRPGCAPEEATRNDVRGWLVAVRDATSSGTARSWFPAVRHFYGWMVAEGEAGTNPTEGIRTPPPNEPVTPVLSDDQLKALLNTCKGGNDFESRRDHAMLRLFIRCGLRIHEVIGLTCDAVDLRDRTVLVTGKGSNRSGPRRRMLTLDVDTTRALDRYLRDRRRHPHGDEPALWLGARNRGAITEAAVDKMVKRRAEQAGLPSLHSHVFRHTWASRFRDAGGNDGDLMTLGGWRNRAMLDRYGKAAAVQRAHAAQRQLNLKDRL